MKTFFLLAILIFPAVVLAQANFEISGKLSNLNVKQVFLKYGSGDASKPLITDSAMVSNGQYHFQGTVGSAVFGMITSADVSDGVGILVIAPEKIEISHDHKLSNTNITGSVANRDFEQIKLLEDFVRQGTDSVKNAGGNTAVVNSALENGYSRFIQENSSSLMALFVLGKFMDLQKDLAKVEPLFNLLSNETRASTQGAVIGEKIRYYLQFKNKSSVGKYAQDFTLINPAGEGVSLSSFRGKFVLLDFWASWCTPCRKDNPYLKTAYQMFHSRGFEILSVSLDVAAARQKWLKAIIDDGIGDWHHVADLDSPVNAAAELYGVRAIPQNFLIDPEGKIIASGLREGQLEKELIKLFKQ